MIIRTIRDIFTSEIDTIWIDEPAAFERAQEFLRVVMPRFVNRIKLYDEKVPLFHKYGIEDEIAKIQRRHVPLPEGGSIVIDQTEALVAIDVNSGNFRVEDDAEKTAYEMNLRAAKEIARQLRLRDLGGVIVNDFIDMREERHRRGVERALREAIKRDRARTKVLRMSAFGLIEMTRQRIRPSLKRSIYEDCPHCAGAGVVKTAESMAIDVMRLLALASHRDDIRRINITVSPGVATYLNNRKRKEIARIEAESSMIDPGRLQGERAGRAPADRMLRRQQQRDAARSPCPRPATSAATEAVSPTVAVRSGRGRAEVGLAGALAPARSTRSSAPRTSRIDCHALPAGRRLSPASPAPAPRPSAASRPGSRNPPDRRRPDLSRCSSITARTCAARSPRCPASTSSRSTGSARRSPRWPSWAFPAIILFGIPEHKDARGSAAAARRRHRPGGRSGSPSGRRPDLLVITDLCFCEYTDHGHCGPLAEIGGRLDVDNDATLPLLAEQAVSHARAGADMIAPSA